MTKLRGTKPTSDEVPLGWLHIMRGTLKLVALVGGGLVTIVCLMAVIGVWTPSSLLRIGGAILVAGAVPLFVADRALARRSVGKMHGVTSDILALTYMGFAVAFVGLAHGATQPLLVAEGERLEGAGRGWTSDLVYLLAGKRGTPVAASKSAEVVADATAKTPSVAPQLRAGDGKERTPAQIFNEFAPSVVTITVKGMLGEGGGTGFVIDAGGTIATNYHVIENASEIEIKLMDGTVLDGVEILATNEPQDLALLHVKASKPLPAVVLGDSEKVTVGERAVSIGNPLGLDHTLTDGLVSARRVIMGRKMIQMSTPVSPGNSGGPLFNPRGEVIGVSTAIYAGGSPLAQNLNLAMPINDLKPMIKREYPGRHKPGAGSTSERW